MTELSQDEELRLATTDGVFRSFIENLPAMFYAVTPTPPHKPIFISPAFERFGYPLEDWLNKPDIWDIVTHPDDRENVLGKTREALKRGESTDFSYRVVCRDGSIAWIRDRGCFIRDADGKAICWQGVIIEITQLMEAKTEVTRREELYRTLARHIPATAVLLFDSDLRYTLADGEQLEAHGWSSEMFEGKTVYEVFPPDVAAIWEEHYKRALAGEKLQSEMKDDLGFYQVNVLPVKDESDRIFAGMVVWQDISGRKRAENSLKKSEARYRKLFDNANDIIYVHDLSGNYISINEAAERIFGYSRMEALEMNLAQIAAPEHLSRVKEQLSSKVEGDASQTVYEIDCIRKDGEHITLEVNSSLVEVDDGTLAVQGIARDITERRHAEDALRKSEAMLAAAQRITHLGSWEIKVTKDQRVQNDSLICSDEVFRIFGYAPRSTHFTPEFLLSSFDADDRPRILRAFNAAVSGSDWPETEAKVITPDGDVRIVRMHAEAIRGSDGTVAAIIGSVQDVTDRRRSELALSQSEARLRDLFENANDLIYTHDLEGNFTSLNRAGERITGYTREEAVQKNIADIVAPEFLDSARTMTAKKLGDSRSTTYELEIIAKDGRRVALELSTRLIVADGLPTGVQGIGRDITDRREAQERLHDTVSLFSSTFESTADGIVVMSLDRKIVTFNRNFAEMWDLPEHVLRSNQTEDLVDFICSEIENGDAFRRELDALYGDPWLSTEGVMFLRDGRVYERHSQPQITNGEPAGRVCCFRDITERTRAEDRLRYYALHDTLTKLPNRAAFMEHLRDTVIRAARHENAKFAVLFLDLDRFKVVNDSLGHSVGDKLLIEIAERLRAGVRPGDVVARLGGDEFTVLLNRIGDLDEAPRIAERLQSKISEAFHIDNYEVFTTASIGIVVSGQIERTADDYLRDADAAMYRAKESGKARYEIFDREMHALNLNLLQKETDLRHAVERSEFEVHYQPIVDLVTGEVSEFEALLRWRHPTKGLVGPNEFVHSAEETGLIVPIGSWILNEACQQIAAWQQECERKLSVSVNLSAKQLMHPRLTAQIAGSIDSAGLEPGQLKLEVTESTVMEHSDQALKVLNGLRRLGVCLSTDDFGTGYSSLSYLQQFPFQRLKIDRSFVTIMDSDEKSGSIVKSILMLGENLGLEIVAEGIETESQWKKLCSLGCRLGQGFFFARPAAAADAEQYLKGVRDASEHASQPRQTSGVIELPDVQ